MPLMEALVIDVGSSIAKSILKLWLKDQDVASDASASIIDVLKSRTKDRIVQLRAQRQFEAIGEKLGDVTSHINKWDAAKINISKRWNLEILRLV